MNLPSVDESYKYLEEAEKMNPGPWIAHSKYVGEAAEIIASFIPELDQNRAKVFGLLHDIGRRVGPGSSSIKHAKDGYDFAMAQGYDELARICLTHSFPIKDVKTVTNKKVSDDQVSQDFVQDFLEKIEYDNYDKLIQLCDALAMSSGFCLMEKRLFDVALRHGINEYMEMKWKKYFELFEYFQNKVDRPLYGILPGVVENTFGENFKK